MQRLIFSALLLFLGPSLFAQTPASSFVDPTYTDIVGRIEMQPIEGARLLYWDQATADALGIETAPGRVGIAGFERDVLSQVGLEVKTGSQELKAPIDAPTGFIELDAHNGSGRAGYVRTRSGAWVNIKGIGQTGYGKTVGQRGPPIPSYNSHRDGSATLEEAIKEAISARVANNELATPSSRVLAIIDTGRVLKFADGREVPLATIVRAPMRRYDRAVANNSSVRMLNISETLAQLNVKRFMKGDIVNQSNIGAGGEMIDFGTFTSTGGHIPAFSSQNVAVLGGEAAAISEFPSTAHKGHIGQHLLQQWGVPQIHVQRGTLANSEAAQRSQDLGQKFRAIVMRGTPVKVDYDALSPEKTWGALRYHENLRDVAADFFQTPQDKDSFVTQQLEKLEARIKGPLESMDSAIRSELREAHKELFSGAWNSLSDVARTSPELMNPESASKIRQVAHHKSRETTDLVRPVLMTRIGDAINQAPSSGDPRYIQSFIDNTVRYNRLSLNPPSDGLFHVAPRATDTDYYLRARRTADGRVQLQAYPEVSFDPKKGEALGFRATTNAWKSHKDTAAEVVETADGLFVRTTLPTRDFPLSSNVADMTPFARDARGGIRWFDVGNLAGPVHAYSHQLGLAPDYSAVPSLMTDDYGVRMNLSPAELMGEHRITPERLEALFLNASLSSEPRRAEFDKQIQSISSEEISKMNRDPRYKPVFARHQDQLLNFKNTTQLVPPKIREREYSRIVTHLRQNPKLIPSPEHLRRLSTIGIRDIKDLPLMYRGSQNWTELRPAAQELVQFLGKNRPALPASILKDLKTNQSLRLALIEASHAPDADPHLTRQAQKFLTFDSPQELRQLVSINPKRVDIIDEALRRVAIGFADLSPEGLQAWTYFLKRTKLPESSLKKFITHLDANVAKNPQLLDLLYEVFDNSYPELRQAVSAHVRSNLKNLDTLWATTSPNPIRDRLINLSLRDLHSSRNAAFEQELIDAYRQFSPENRVRVARSLIATDKPSKTRLTLERMIRKDGHTQVLDTAISNKGFRSINRDTAHTDMLLTRLEQLVKAKDFQTLSQVFLDAPVGGFTINADSANRAFGLISQLPDAHHRYLTLRSLTASTSNKKPDFIAQQLMRWQHDFTTRNPEFSSVNDLEASDDLRQAIRERFGPENLHSEISTRDQIKRMANSFGIDSRTYQAPLRESELKRVFLELRKGSHAPAVRRALIENLHATPLSATQSGDLLEMVRLDPSFRSSVAAALRGQASAPDEAVAFMKSFSNSADLIDRHRLLLFLAKQPGQEASLAANIVGMLSNPRTPVSERTLLSHIIPDLPSSIDTSIQKFLQSPEWRARGTESMRLELMKTIFSHPKKMSEERILSYFNTLSPVTRSEEIRLLSDSLRSSNASPLVKTQITRSLLQNAGTDHILAIFRILEGLPLELTKTLMPEIYRLALQLQAEAPDILKASLVQTKQASALAAAVSRVWPDYSSYDPRHIVAWLEKEIEDPVLKEKMFAIKAEFSSPQCSQLYATKLSSAGAGP